MNRLICIGVLAATLCVLLFANVVNSQTITIKEVNPTHSSKGGNAATGGRVNNLGRATDNILYAASEFGGLFKSTNAGRTWSRLDSYLPTRMWGVKASPADPDLIIATAIYDGRVNSLAGISFSRDGGVTWRKPTPSTVPLQFGCAITSALSEPSAFGIAFDPENPATIYVGTNCGLAKSNDGALNWRFINPEGSPSAKTVYDVVVHHGGIIDICGAGGHRRSIDGGVNWDGPKSGGTPLPNGRCSLAVSPDESAVLFATVGTKIFESDDGGRSWDTEFANPKSAGRLPFVVTNKRQGRNFDLWFGNLSIFRAACRTPATPGPGARCPASNTWIASNSVSPESAHVDMSDLLFSDSPRFDAAACRQACPRPTVSCQNKCDKAFDSCISKVGETGGPLRSQCVRELAGCELDCSSASNACITKCNRPQEGCPTILSSDGGTYINTESQSPACQKPRWTQADITIRALHLWSLSGSNIPNSPTSEALYMAAQDNGAFATSSAGAATPDWKNPIGADSFDMVSDSFWVVFTRCCFGQPRTNQVFVHKPGLSGGKQIPNYPPGLVPRFKFPDAIAQFGANRYAIITDKGIFATLNLSANPIIWTPLGTNAPTNACGLWAAGSPTDPTFFALTGRCSGNSPETLMRFKGTLTTGTWRNVPLPTRSSGVGVFTVDPHNPNRLFVSSFDNLSGNRVGMFRSSNGGVNWESDPELDGLMSGGGVFRLQTSKYAQPTLVAFDTNDTNNLLAGAYDAGIFLSTDNGNSWKTVTNNSGDAANPVIPRPHWAYFDRECSQHNIYVGTQGRGAWRFSYPDSAGTTASACQARCEISFPDCQDRCNAQQKACLADGKLPSQCTPAFTTCRAGCSTTRNTCRQRCVDCPQ